MDEKQIGLMTQAAAQHGAEAWLFVSDVLLEQVREEPSILEEASYMAGFLAEVLIAMMGRFGIRKVKMMVQAIVVNAELRTKEYEERERREAANDTDRSRRVRAELQP
jgi:hypothetical protein